MANIFINYRRADSMTVASIIFKKLEQKKHKVFMDREIIPIGSDFSKFIEKEIPKYDVMLSLINNQWRSIKDAAGKIRIKQPGDHVRVELLQALKTDKIKIIPVLIDGVKMPGKQDLPADLQEFANLNAVDFLSWNFDESADHIVKEVEKILNIEKSRDLSPFIKIISLRDDRCVVNAFKNALEANLRIKNIDAVADLNQYDNDTLEVSRLKKGQGTYFRSAIYAAEQFGLHFTKWKVKSAAHAHKKTKDLKIPVIRSMQAYPLVSAEMEEMIRHLNDGRAIVAGVSVYESTWYNKQAAKDGKLFSLPKKGEQVTGGHAIVITKVDAVRKEIKFANSWGKEWGDKGFGYFTEESFRTYLVDKNLWAVEVPAD